MQQELQLLEEHSNLRRLPRMVHDGRDVIVNGKRMLNLSSNDYLGLASDRALREEFLRTLTPDTFLPTSSSSRLLTGNFTVYEELEAELAHLFGTEAALVFNSGYHANTGILPAVSDAQTLILADKLVHASLIDGARLSGARLSTFLHNDMESLRKKLQHLRNANPSGGILVVTESVFSMDGDRAPLREIVRLKDEFGALLLVDEAHGFGVLGEHGAGLAEELGVSSRIDFQMGTLSKAAGVSGGYVACSRAWADVMVNSARSLIYSTAPPPALAAAALAAVEGIRSGEGKELRRRVSVLANSLSAALGMPGRPVSSIFPVVVGENDAALAAADALLEQGFLAPAIRYPTVPRGTARLRITVTAAHESGQVTRLGTALKELLHGK